MKKPHQRRHPAGRGERARMGETHMPSTDFGIKKRDVKATPREKGLDTGEIGGTELN